MKIFDNHVYHSSMNKNELLEDSPDCPYNDPRMYKDVWFFDVTTSQFFKTKPIMVINAWMPFTWEIHHGYEPKLIYFYDDLGLQAPQFENTILKKEPWLRLYACEHEFLGPVIAIDFELF